MNRIAIFSWGIVACAVANVVTAATTSLTARDKDFVDNAMVAGMKEVELSRLVQTRAMDARIRAFAEQMVADHGKANDVLAALARDNGWDMPTQLDSSGQTELGKMQERNGKDLDTAYMKGMVEDHDKAVKLFRDAANGSDNPILRDFAKAELPTIEHHQAMARDLK